MQALKSGKIWRVALPVAVLALVGGAILFARRDSAAATSEGPALQTSVARRGNLELIAGGSGSLVPAATVDVRFQGPGDLVSLSVALGDVVVSGQELARVDDTDARAALAEAELVLGQQTSASAVAQARLDLAEARTATVDRWNGLALLISPAVLTWEERVVAAEKTLADPAAASEGAALDQAERDLKNAQAGLAWAQKTYQEDYLEDTFSYSYSEGSGRDRVEVTALDVPTQDEIDQARSALDLARADEIEAEALLQALSGGDLPAGATGAGLVSLEKARQALAAAQTQLEATRLVAPIAGTVTSLDLVVGQTVSAADGVTLMDLSRPVVEFFVDEADIQMVAVGNEVEVVFDAYPDSTFSGRVVHLDPVLTTSGGVNALRGLAELDGPTEDPSPRLFVGLAAAIDVIAGRAEQAVLIPVEALRQVSPGSYAVFVVGEDGSLTLRPVAVGLQDLTFAAITSGLEVGEVVSTGMVEVGS